MVALVAIAVATVLFAPDPRPLLRRARPPAIETNDVLAATAAAGAALALGLAAHTAAILGVSVVGVSLARRVSSRAAEARRIRVLLPGVAESLAAAMRAGLPLGDGLVAIASGQIGPVAAALRETAAALRLGRPLDDALAPLQRTFGAAGLLVGETIRAFHRRGGDLPRSLERAASLARSETQLEDEIRALTAQGRTSALVLASLAPFGLLFYVVANPSAARELAADPRGQALLSAAIALEAIGALWLWRLVRR